MNTLDIAAELYEDLGSPASPDEIAISTWLQYNIGKLNILLSADYSIADDGTISEELDDDEKVIFKELYLIRYYEKLINSNLGAASYDWSEMTEGDTTVRRVSKNEIAKNYMSLKKALEDELNTLVFRYRHNRATPASYSAYADFVQYYRKV